MNKFIIHHLSQTDAYKLSMAYVIYHLYRKYKTGWSFKFRNMKDHLAVMTPAKMQEWVEEIQKEISHLATLRWTEEEISFISKKMPWLTLDGGLFLDWLRNFQVKAEDILVFIENGELRIETDEKASWLQSTFYEIYLLVIINETGFRLFYNYDELLESHKRNTDKKFEKLLSGEYVLGAISEFGLRRELSEEAQEYVIKKFMTHRDELKEKGTNYVGTSNVYMSMKYGTTPIGTMAHEFIMGVGQGDPAKNPAYSNRFAMEAWTQIYGVLNGIFLTDTITDKMCRMDMDFKFASSFKGVRNDSGDPIEWGENWIKHYEKLGIDPKTKTLLFSNSLDFKRADEIYRHFAGRINVAFGIGTYLSNDTFVNPFNIVMKMTTCNGHPVAKISDDAGKGMCKSEEFVNFLMKAIDWKATHGY